MGNPLSGTIADIFINYNERTYILNNRNKHRDKIIYWHRYVDDILILFDGTLRQLSQLHKYINSINQQLQFTIEVEVEKNIKFLDLSITHNNENKHEFSIYRKPTHTDHTIHISSNHPHSHKLAAYTHMIDRLNKIPMTIEKYTEELHTIKYIAKRNGFTSKIIENMNNKLKKKIDRTRLTTLTINTKEAQRYISLDYNNLFNNLTQKIFRQHGYTIAFRTNNKLRQKLKPKTNKIEDSGIYKLSCNECTKFYIGQTGRSFKKRFNEHIQEIKKPTSTIKSNYALHLKSENHTFTDFDKNVKILHKINKNCMMSRLEEVEIYRHKNNENLLNDKIKENCIYEYIINL